MTRSSIASLFFVVLFAQTVTGAARSTDAASALADRCHALGRADFSRIQDAPTRITAARWVASNRDEPGYCQIAGVVAPQVGFALRLPGNKWNGKFIELGCGGFCGSTGDGVSCSEVVRRGYACITSDGGHTGPGNRWAYNNLAAEFDYGYRAPHVTALAGKALLAHYYGQALQKSYFVGCSSGGRQALMQAQRFPWDFDGIVALCPSIGVPAIHMTMLWGYRALTDESGAALMGQAELDRLHEAVVAKCDQNDGVEDGLIGDPRSCDFEPQQLRCGGDKTTQCLTAKQVEAVEKLYRGPITSTGAPIYPPGAMKGSERGWLIFTQIADFAAEEFRYSGFYPNVGPTWQPKDFDFDRDHKRLGLIEGLYTAANPDLRRFKAAGGKLIATVGWADAIGMPLPVVDYYETVEKTMGGRESTQDFFRLFAIPGGGHCGGGAGASEVDWLAALEAWVERGEAPKRLVAAHLKPGAHASTSGWPLPQERIEFSRPVYPYPTQVRYLGQGDPKDAANFGPVEPSSGPDAQYVLGPDSTP